MKHLLIMFIGLSVLIMRQNILLMIPVLCKWEDKYCTQKITYFSVFGQHLSPINIEYLAPDALHPNIKNYFVLYVTEMFSLINPGMPWKLWESIANIVPI